MDTKSITDSLRKPVVSGLIAGLLTRYVTYGSNQFGEGYSIAFADKVSSSVSENESIMNKIFNLRNIPPFSSLVGKSYSLAVVTGILVFTGSLMTDFVSGRVFAFVTDDDKMDQLDSAVFQIASTSAGTVLGHYIVNDASIDERGLYNIVALASVSEYVAQKIVKRYRRYVENKDEEEVSYDFSKM